MQARYGLQVADELYEREIVTQLYSTSGEWDLLVQFHPPKDVDIGQWVNENVLDIIGIERSLTTLAHSKHLFKTDNTS